MSTENTVVVRKTGNLLDISLPGNTALTDNIKRLLEPQLIYEKRKFNYGFDLYDPITGIRHDKVQSFDKHCYRYDAFGRLVTNFGFVYRITNALKKSGYNISFVASNIPSTNPKAYESDWDSVTKHFSFRQRQDECLKNIISKPCGVIHAVTGFGKLVMIAMTCLAFPYAKIAVATKRAPLVNKIRDFLTRYIPNVGQVGAAQGKNVKGDRVTVYTCASLHHADFETDFLLVDEGHEAISDKYSAQLARFMHSRNYTFTATPKGRLDGTDIRLEALFGKTIFYLPYPEAVKLGLVVPIKVEWTDVFLDDNPAAGLEDVEKKRMGIWTNQGRNKIIANKARTFSDDEQVLILTETIEHAVHLRQFLPEYTLVYDQLEDKRFNWYKAHDMLPDDEPAMTPSRKEELRKSFESGGLKKAVATKMWSVGIDPVELVALFRTEGVDNEIMDVQAPGRVSRTHNSSGKDVGIVCDFRDQFDDGFSRRAKARYHNYRITEWEQVLVMDDGREVPFEKQR